jgi:hypothetical protein
MSKNLRLLSAALLAAVSIADKGLATLLHRPYATMLISTLRRILASATVCLGFALPAAAQIPTTSNITGTTDSLNLSVTLSTESRFIGNGKLYFVMLHNNQFYLLSETRGFIPYTGSEIPEYKTIGSSKESITLNNWNTRGQLGAEIFVGYGSDFFEMLSSGRFKHVATLEDLAIPIDPYTSLNRAYSCYNSLGMFVETLTFSFKMTEVQIYSGQRLIHTIPAWQHDARGPTYAAVLGDGKGLYVLGFYQPQTGGKIPYTVSYVRTYRTSADLDPSTVRVCN